MTLRTAESAVQAGVCYGFRVIPEVISLALSCLTWQTVAIRAGGDDLRVKLRDGNDVALRHRLASERTREQIAAALGRSRPFAWRVGRAVTPPGAGRPNRPQGGGELAGADRGRAGDVQGPDQGWAD